MSDNEKKLGFIGVGNMGGALVKGVVKSGFEPSLIYISDVDDNKASALAGEAGVNTAETSGELVSCCDIIVLAVKPNIMRGLLDEIKAHATAQKLFITVAAALPIKFYKDILGKQARVIRAMPNMPALIGEGITMLSFGDMEITADERNFAVRLFSSTGMVEIIDEKYMNKIISLTSSSPAYVFMLIEALSDGAVLSGLPKKLSARLAAQAVLGAAKMALETGISPSELKDQVCSPGGTTIEAVIALEKNNFKFAVIDAMNECNKKADKITALFDTKQESV